MDYIASTISFDQIDDLFQLPRSSLPYQERGMDEIDEILFAASPPDWNQILAGDDLLSRPAPPADLQPVVAPPACGAVEQKNGESGKKRKIVHRNVERQRRQEMASLYGSLRSRLPTELLKGKRSISDHIHQAVGYIRILQNKIQVLNEKRDELKRVSDPNHTSCDPKANKEEHPRSACRPLDMVAIESCIEGVEIIVSTDSRQGVALSKVLNFLVEEGINVISYTSTTVNERLLHSIKSEVIGDSGIGSTNSITELKIKLMTQFC